MNVVNYLNPSAKNLTIYFHTQLYNQNYRQPTSLHDKGAYTRAHMKEDIQV